MRRAWDPGQKHGIVVVRVCAQPGLLPRLLRGGRVRMPGEARAVVRRSRVLSIRMRVKMHEGRVAKCDQQSEADENCKRPRH